LQQLKKEITTIYFERFSIMQKRYFIILGILLLLFGNSTLAQTDPLLRLELEVPSTDIEYYMIPCDTSGFIVFYQTVHVEKNKRIWMIKFYNQLLIEQWVREIPIIDDLEYSKGVYNHDHLYISFYKNEKIKNGEINFQVLKLKCSDGNFEVFGKEAPPQSYIRCFKIIDENVISGFNTNKKTVEILKLNTLKRTHELFFSTQESSAILEDIYVDQGTASVLFVINYFESKSNQLLRIFKYQSAGNSLWNKSIIADSEKKLNTCKISIVDDQPILMGTYDIKKTNISEKNYFKNESTGFYSVKIKNGINKIRYFNFLDFENFKGFMVGSEYQKLKDKNKKSGNESVEYDLLLHEIYKEDSNLFFIGEAFYEEYHSETDFYYDYYGRAVPITYTVFDGYRYFNTFVVSFNFEGEMLWDNGFELFDLISPFLQKKINYFNMNADIVLAYNQDSKIASKIFSGEDVLDGISHYSIESDYKGDKIMESTANNLIQWYDNYFLAYGIQTIHNRNALTKNKRIVFYVNKLGFK